MPSQMTPAIQQLQPPNNHQIGPQQSPPIHMPPGQPTAGPRPPQQGVPPQISQQAAPPSTQIGLPPIPQSHIGPSSGPVTPGSLVPPGTVVGLPPQIGSQPSTLPGNQGSSMPVHVVSNAAISSQSSGVIQIPAGTGSGPATSQALPGLQVSNVPTMQEIAQIRAAQSMPFQSVPPIPVTVSEALQDVEDSKPKTAELISFD